MPDLGKRAIRCKAVFGKRCEIQYNRPIGAEREIVHSFFDTSRTFTVRYAGLSFYWAWVFLSFNSSDLTVQGGSHEILSIVHVVSSAAAMVTFVLAIVFHRAIMAKAPRAVGIWLCAGSVVAFAGTLMYTFPEFSGNDMLSVAGAVISGLTCSAIVLAWGVVYRDLSARNAVLFTSMTFFGAAVLYFIVSLLGGVASSVVVSLFPVLAAVLAAVSLNKQRAGVVGRSSDTMQARKRGELAQLMRTGLSWRIVVGLVVALFVCGGMRVYFGDIAPVVYRDPLLMALPLAFGAIVFFVYGMFVSRTSLNLGILYRVAMPLFALALVLIALFGGDNAPLAFFMMSTASVLFEILTWALLVEITRTTHYSPLLIFAVGRLAVHGGIVAGELVAFAMIGNLVVFAVLAIGLLFVSVGFTFSDRDTTFLFEPPTPEELKRLVRVAGRGTGDSLSREADGFVSPAAVPMPSDDGSGAAVSGQSESVVDDDVLIRSNLTSRIDAMAKEYGFSPREKEVFALWVTGRGSKYIQETFVISEATVKTHVRHIYEKCDVHNRAELMGKLEAISC